jgi:hypothetical protein
MDKNIKVETIENKVKVLEIEVHEITVKNSDGSIKNKFNAYKTYLTNGKIMDVRFPQQVKNLPKENCYIKVNSNDVNIDKSHKFPRMWIQEILEIIERKALQRKPEQYKEVDTLLYDEENLPF